MFKLVVLSALFAIAVARPGHISSPIVKHTVVETQGYAKVGEIVEHVPTAVSHQSSTIVHNKAAVVTPIVAPVVHQTIVAEAPIHHDLHHDAHLVQHTIVDAAPVHHHGEAQLVVTVPEHHESHYEHHDDDEHDDGQYDHHDGHYYEHEHDDHDDGHYDHHDHESYEHHNADSIVIASVPAGHHHGDETVAGPIQHHESYGHHVAEPAVVYSTAPAETHHHSGEGGETKTVSKSYVAEPDSVRYTEQTHSEPHHHHVEYIAAAAPVVHKTIVSVPQHVKYVHAEPEHYQHHW